jgi:hypothetical protein
MIEGRLKDPCCRCRDYHGRDVFLTSDEPILRLRAELAECHVEVMTPADFLAKHGFY